MEKQVRKQTLENGKEIIGEFYFTKTLTSKGKTEYNKYIVSIYNPYKSVSGLTISNAIKFEKFDVKDEAIKFFNQEFKRATEKGTK